MCVCVCVCSWKLWVHFTTQLSRAPLSCPGPLHSIRYTMYEYTLWILYLYEWYPPHKCVVRDIATYSNIAWSRAHDGGNSFRYTVNRLVIVEDFPDQSGFLILGGLSTQYFPSLHNTSSTLVYVREQLEHNSNGLPLVDVVVDPHLSRSLRPHQREGVLFLYECVMGMREYIGSGAILAWVHTPLLSLSLPPPPLSLLLSDTSFYWVLSITWAFFFS